MPSSAKAWVSELITFAEFAHQFEPAPLRQDLSPEAEQQCRVIGGHLLSWWEKWGPPLIMERNILADIKGWDKDPHIVFLTEGPGLAAANELLSGREEDVTWLTPSQFQSFLEMQPDKDMTHHCILESWFYAPPPDEDSALRLQQYLGEEGTLSIHHDHTLMGPLFTRGGLHLWHYEADKMNLVLESFRTWIS